MLLLPKEKPSKSQVQASSAPARHNLVHYIIYPSLYKTSD